MKTKTILGLLLFSLVLVSACTTASGENNAGNNNEAEMNKDNLADKNDAMKDKDEDNAAMQGDQNDDSMIKDDMKKDTMDKKGWKAMSLKDVKTGEEFSVDSFKGKTVLLESFAVWCPTCTKQQKVNEEFHKENPDVVSIALNTDPNEAESTVVNHIDSNEFTGKYAVAPKEYTQSLIDEFGTGIVNAPSVPMILICEDGSTRLLGKGLKSADTLKNEIAIGCSA